MASGGYRPGAGRPKGSKDKKKREKNINLDEIAKIKELIKNDTKAKAKFYQEFLNRIAYGESLSISEKKMMSQLYDELKSVVGDDGPAHDAEEAKDVTPLEFMLVIMNNEAEDKETRMKMAIAAAPYIHAKVGEGSKKDEVLERAKKAAQKFAPANLPKLKVVK